MNKNDILQALTQVKFSGSNNTILEDNLVTNVQIFGNEIELNIALPSPVLHHKKKLEQDIRQTIISLDEKAKIVLHFSKKEFNRISAKENALNKIQNIVAIASGKGGVGKSTMTANLAICLKSFGFSVGILDADIYGPSIPLMFDVPDAKPVTTNINGKSKMTPIESYGIKLLSIGFFASLNQAVVWRGPMASKALHQLIHDAHWGDLDFLLIDLPPGTGDIHLSLVQQLPLSGAIIVSTPQNIALADAKKGIAMFQMDAIKVPVLGLVQNMSYLNLQNGEKEYIFGENGVKHLANDSNIPFLGEIPIIQKIREASDVGYPIALHKNHVAAKAYTEISKNMISSLATRNKTLPPSEIVRITTMAGCSAINTKK